MKSKKRTPVCYIVAGPNGAGKTTFALSYLPSISGCRNFINADMIAQGLSPLDPDAVQLEAGRLFLKEIENKVKLGEDFSFETTLAGKTYLRLIRELRSVGWLVKLFYLFLPDSGFSAKRVKERVRQGGHDIPDDAIVRRFPRSVSNLFVYMENCDYTICYDNSKSIPELIFEKDAKEIKIKNTLKFNMLKRIACHA